jgi:hypothetical protein
MHQLIRKAKKEKSFSFKIKAAEQGVETALHRLWMASPAYVSWGVVEAVATQEFAFHARNWDERFVTPEAFRRDFEAGLTEIEDFFALMS